MKKYLLFDLDGTLTDPKRGICTCVQYALEAFGIHEPDLDRLEPFIGPPLKESFMEFYHMEAGQAEAAVEKYRERTGRRQNPEGPGGERDSETDVPGQEGGESPGVYDRGQAL